MSYAMGPQLPDGGFSTMVRNIVVKLMSEQREPDYIINAVCYEIDGYMGNIQARCSARAGMDGSTAYSTVQEEVRAWLWQNLAPIKERIAYQQQMQMQQHYGGQMPYGGGYPQAPMQPMYQQPQQQYPTQYPGMGQTIGQGYSQAPMQPMYQQYDPTKSAYQNEHHPSIISTGVRNIAADLINETHNSAMQEAQMYGAQSNQGFQQSPQSLNSFAASTGAGVFQTNPAQVNAQQYSQPQQQAVQQPQQAPVQRMTQEEVEEYKNPKQPRMVPQFFTSQRIKTITEKNQDDKVERYSISETPVTTDTIEPSVATYEMTTGVSGDTSFTLGKVDYKVPSLNPLDVLGSMRRLLPNTFPLKKPYFIEVRYPELRGKFIGRPLSEGGFEKIIDTYNYIQNIGTDLNNGDVDVGEVVFELHAKLTASTDIDRRVGNYLYAFLLDQVNKKMRFNLCTNKDAGAVLAVSNLEALTSLSKFEELPDFPKDIKNRFTPYGDNVRKTIISCLTSSFHELLNPLLETVEQGVTLAAWDPIIDIRETDHSLFSFLKHPEVSPAIAELVYNNVANVGGDVEESPIVVEADAETNTVVETDSDLVDMSSIREDLEKYFFHLVTKRVIITNIKDVGIDPTYMGGIINTRIKYQHGIYQAILNNSPYGTIVPILSIDEFGDCKNQYMLGQNLDESLLIMKSTDY